MGVLKVKRNYFIFLFFAMIIFLVSTSLIKINKPTTKPNNYKFTIKELKQIQKLADEGDPESQNKIGWMYDQGIGFKKDTKKAIQWYLKSANQGFRQAKINLGVMYELGRGIGQDFAQARKWYLSGSN